MTLLCLVGRHGCGKSTIGRALASHGYQHISVGALRRLAKHNEYPSDVPVQLIAALRRAPRDAAMPMDVVRKLLAFAAQFPQTVIDGFPVESSHLELLPHEAVVGLVWTPARSRESRLLERNESSSRIWTPGGHSLRDQKLPALIRAARARGQAKFIANRVAGPESIEAIAAAVAAMHT